VAATAGFKSKNASVGERRQRVVICSRIES
jgi:hypothetical protein